MNNNCFLNYQLLGKLKVIKVFVFYDVPRTFVCENQTGTKYLFSETRDEEDLVQWFVVSISSFRFTELLRNQIYLREALVHPESSFMLRLSLNISSNEITHEFLDKCPADEIIQSDFYVGRTDNHSSDLHNILEASKKEGSPQLDVVVDDYEDSLPGLDSVSFSDLSEKSRLFLSSLYGRPINPLIYTLNGSFVIRININEPTNIFDGQDSIECIKTFNKVIKEKDSNCIYSLLKNDRKTANRYVDFLSTLIKINKDIRIVTAVPDDTEPTISLMKLNNIIETKKNIAELLLTETKEYDISGVLVEFNSKKPSFQILTDENALIKGTYDPSISNPDIIYGVNGHVKGTIKETIYLNNDGTPAKKKRDYLLLRLEFKKSV